jgi:hypothetical protein
LFFPVLGWLNVHSAKQINIPAQADAQEAAAKNKSQVFQMQWGTTCGGSRKNLDGIAGANKERRWLLNTTK